ncbi:MAG TPA: DUF2085 domain-containing protein [candidate division Zixibacteria bacterium]|nr:DUF2085 domain-containing protein [candidate division Zixibacteria bacterium]
MKLLKHPPFLALDPLSSLFSRRQWAVGVLGLIVLAFLVAPWPLYDKLWGIAFGICPQRPGHSLFFGGVQMPIEAREGGMYAGFLLGFAYLVILGRGKARELPLTKILALLIGFIVLMGLDGLNAVAYDLYLPTLYVPNLLMRSGTGLLTGLALAAIMLPVFNQTIWQESMPVESLSGWRDTLPALLIVAVFWLAGLSGLEPLLYPVSIVAIFGQVILMVGLGAMMASILLRREGQVGNITELAPLILLGLVAVVVLLGATSAVRFAFFGPGPIPAWR